MRLFPSLNHETVLTLTLPQWWAIAGSVDDWRKEQARKKTANRRASSRTTRPRRSR